MKKTIIRNSTDMSMTEIGSYIDRITAKGLTKATKLYQWDAITINQNTQISWYINRDSVTYRICNLKV